MRRTTETVPTLLFAVVATLTAAFLSPNASAITNGGFESGDLTGWSTYFEGGWILDSETDESHYLGSDANNAPYFINNGYEVPLVEVVGSDAPAGDSHMLRLRHNQSDLPEYPYTDGEGNEFDMAPFDYTISIQQILSLATNDIVSGLARFLTYDLPDYADFASVTINDEVVWYENIAGIFDLDEYETNLFVVGDWQTWSWTAPTSGDYLLSLNIYGDDQDNSHVFFDNIAVSAGGAPDAVPDAGSTASALALGLLALAAARRRSGR